MQALAILAQMPHRRVSPDVITHNAAISACQKAQQWEQALVLLRFMATRKYDANTVSFNAAISACSSTQQLGHTVSLLLRMRAVVIETNGITYSAAINACDVARDWVMALGFVTQMQQVSLEFAVIGCCAAISACAGAQKWVQALGLTATAQRLALQQTAALHNAAISACAQGGEWRHAVAVFQAMTARSCEADAITCKTTISVCARAGRLSLALGLLVYLQRTIDVPGGSSFGWALARLTVADFKLMRVITEEAFLQLQDPKFGPDDAAMLAWVLAVVGIKRPELFRLVSQKALAQARQLSLQGLSSLAWALATSCPSEAPLFMAIENETAARLRSLIISDIPSTSLSAVARDLCSIIWSLNFLGTLSEKLKEEAHRAVSKIGQALDANGRRLLSFSTAAAPMSSPGEPSAVLDLRDRLVVEKPPGWQVDTGEGKLVRGKPLSQWMRSRGPDRFCPIAVDISHSCGFVHRLDVPSSGLILVAKTYEAYYQLKMQLSSGDLVREYSVLSHGLSGQLRRLLDLQIQWTDGSNSPSAACVRGGRPARTYVQPIAHVVRWAQAFTFFVVTIQTGRRHQIRVHLAHVGHPTVCDGKYTATDTLYADSAWCHRNFLHRHLLIFSDHRYTEFKAAACLPQDLMETIQRVSIRPLRPSPRLPGQRSSKFIDACDSSMHARGQQWANCMQQQWSHVGFAEQSWRLCDFS